MDKASEAATRLFIKGAWALSIQTHELITTRKRFSKLYKITLVFKSRQGVDRFIRGANWVWLKYTVTKVYRRPRKISSLDRERLSSGQSFGRNRRMYKRSDRWWRKKMEQWDEVGVKVEEVVEVQEVEVMVVEVVLVVEAGKEEVLGIVAVSC